MTMANARPADAPPAVDRRSALSYRDFVSEYLMPQKPVIITDALTAWPALTKWTPEFFKTVHADKRIVVQGTPMRMGDYIDMVLASTDEKPCPYLSNCLVRQHFPEIAEDIVPDLKYTLPDRVRSVLMVGSQRSRVGLPELLITGRGGKFRLHYDSQHMLGFVTQIYGPKEFMLFAPSDTPYLYSVKDNPNRSDIVSPWNVDLNRFPLFAKATPYQFTLQPGETIFNPAGWWHGTRLSSPSIAMVISTINGSNWDAFADDIGRPRPGVPRIATSALRAYLSLAGALLTVKEQLFFRSAD
jgi:histone arginine demethylase JMJD6